MIMCVSCEQDDRDHCAGAPCGNGAACYTAQSDYYCHCAPGWTGKNCTQRAPRPLAPPEPCGAAGPCSRGRCLRAPPASPRCLCDPGYGGALCDEREHFLFNVQHFNSLRKKIKYYNLNINESVRGERVCGRAVSEQRHLRRRHRGLRVRLSRRLDR